MARVPLSVVPDVDVAATPPNDYQNINPSPAAFGGASAQATQRLGAETQQAGGDLTQIAVIRQQRFNQVAVADALNQQQEQYRDVTFGNPKDPTQKGFYQMQGREALDAYPDADRRLTKIRTDIHAGLQNDAQRQEFDQASRRFQMFTTADMGRHADQQSKAWETNVNTSTEANGLSDLALKYNDNEAFNHSLADIRSGRIRNLQTKFGMNVDAAVVEHNFNQITAEAVKARAIAWSNADPAAAGAWLKTGTVPDINGRPAPVTQFLDPLQRSALVQHLEAKGDAAAAARSAVSAYQGSGSNLGATIQAAATAHPGANADTLRRTAMLENTDANPNAVSSAGARGRFQFVGKTAAQYGLTNPEDLGQAADAAARLQIDNRRDLTAALGTPPTEAQIYLAHQQGAGGAAKLLQHPDLPAALLVGAPAILQNGGYPGMTAGEFTRMWSDRFNAAGDAPASTNNVPDHTTDRALGFSRLTAELSAGRITPQGFELATSQLLRMFAVDDAIKKDAAEQANNEYIPQALKAPGAFPMDRMLADNRLTGTQKNMLWGIVNRALKGDIDKPTEISQYVRTQLLDGIREGTVTDPQALVDAVAHRGLSTADYGFVRQRWDEAQTGDGRKLSSQTTDLFKAAEKDIEGTLLAGIRNPNAGMDFLKYKSWAYQQIAEAQKEGKPLAPMFDPSSPQWLGDTKVIQRFRSSMNDVMQGRMSAMGLGGTVAQAEPAADLSNAAAIKAAVERGYLGQKGGISYAEGLAALAKIGVTPRPAPTVPPAPANAVPR